MLCEECRDELSSPIRITPEQIQLRIVRPTMAALIDLWGRAASARCAHARSAARSMAQGLAILEPSVSRHHAHLTLDNGVWTLRDLGSANGTFHDDKLIEGPVAGPRAATASGSATSRSTSSRRRARCRTPRVGRTVTRDDQAAEHAGRAAADRDQTPVDRPSSRTRRRRTSACPRCGSGCTSRPAAAAASSRSTASRSSSRRRSSS